MERFGKGNFAFTCNSRAPSVNDGHLVNILEVIGPMPSHGIAFGYLIERVDGKPFEITCRGDSPMPAQGAQRTFADQHQLRPLGRRRPRRSKRARSPFVPRRDLVNPLAG